MRCKLSKKTYVFWILVETSFYELLELFGEGSCELGRVVLRYEEEDPHGVEVGVGRLTLRQLDGRDAQAPHVSLRVVR